MKNREVVHDRADGRDIVRVPIARDGQRYAVIFKSDWKDLTALGMSGNWFTIKNTVCARIPGGKTILVARAILNAQPGQIVRYLDGDGLNLRYDNLQLFNGGFSVNADRRLLLLAKAEAKEKRKGGEAKASLSL